MSEFTIYGVPGSPYVRAALLGLEEKGCDWHLQAMPFGGFRSAEHRARNPFGRIPVLDHGDFRLYEAQAILRYLDRILPEPRLTPRDPRAEARMNQICGITDWYVMPEISRPITFARLVAPKLGLPVDETKVADAIPKAEVCIAEISRLLGDQHFMAGDEVSIADLMLAPHLVMFAETSESAPMLARHENIRPWVERMNARASMMATTWEKVHELARAA
ncbi:MAG TPA: glutathione S-transferase family protein [Xanthobacteraceae bacterium]|jgi:glutathione S-transferase|nr:glutathione S-transferase family protein [Xanthobacteraceae bacterium]